MTPIIPNRGRLRAATLITTFVSTLLLVATTPSVATPHRERWQWPTGGPVAIVEEFTPPAHDRSPGRREVTLQYLASSPMYACASDTMTVAGPIAGRGVVSIRHEVDGRVVWSTCLPMTSSVVVGDHVQKGSIIDLVGGGSLTLYWDARTGRCTYIDPIHMTLGRPRLLP